MIELFLCVPVHTLTSPQGAQVSVCGQEEALQESWCVRGHMLTREIYSLRSTFHPSKRELVGDSSWKQRVASRSRLHYHASTTSTHIPNTTALMHDFWSHHTHLNLDLASHTHTVTVHLSQTRTPVRDTWSLLGTALSGAQPVLVVTPALCDITGRFVFV